MNELQVINDEITMTSVEVTKLINKFRREENNEKVLQHKNFMASIRSELESLEKAGIEVPELNIKLGSYKDKQNQERKCYIMGRSWIMQMCNKESALVRYKTQQYIEALENKIKEQNTPTLTRKQELQLKLFSKDSIEVVNAHKELVELEVQEATKPLKDKIKEDEPLVAFSERVLKEGDNILIRDLAKIASDEGYKIGEKRLYNKLREWNYICKTSTKPTQYAMERDYFVVETNTINTPYGTKQVFTTKATPKAQVHIVERLMKELNNKELSLIVEDDEIE